MMKIIKKTLVASLGMIAVLNISGCGGSSNTTDQTETTHVEPISDNTTPVIPVDTTPIDNTPQYTPAGWYMKTSVSATDPATSTVYSHKTAGIFGELDESSDGKDRHDIPGYGSAILQVVFVQTTWDSDNGDYFSDYRANSGENEKKVWTFQVKNEKDVHLENADITIMLKGVYDVASLEEDGRIRYKETLSNDSSKKEALKLVDVDNQQVYTYEELQNVQLNMDGKNIRTFRWVIGDVDSEDYASLNPIVTKSAATRNKTVSQNPSTGFVFEEKQTVEEVFGE